MTGAERARAFRARKKAKAAPVPVPILTPTPAVMPVTRPVTHRYAGRIAPLTLTVAALSLAAVGMAENGWFARSLGSSEFAGWLFLAVGAAADSVALVMPSVATVAWQARQRGAAAAGWVVWLMTFAFAVTAGIGFASLNITDVTMARAAHVTPTVVMAQISLTDAMAARDRECHVVGKWCRERETAVSDRRAALDVAMQAVAQTADPQTVAAVKLVSWVSRGTLQPTGDDFAMLRLILLALLPQVGGILLMVTRLRAASGTARGEDCGNSGGAIAVQLGAIHII